MDLNMAVHASGFLIIPVLIGTVVWKKTVAVLAYCFLIEPNCIICHIMLDSTNYSQLLVVRHRLYTCEQCLHL